MSYSASTLDEPPPRWSAYNPKYGVSWIPASTSHQDTSLRSRTASSSLQNALGSASALFRSPRGRRNRVCVATSERTRSVSSLPSSTPSCSSTESSPRRLSLSSLLGLKRFRSKSSLSRDSVCTCPESLSLSSPDVSLDWDEYDCLDLGHTAGHSRRTDSPRLDKTEEEDEPCNPRLQFHLDRDDLTCLYIDRSHLVTGRLLMKDHWMSVCNGTLRRKCTNYPAYIQPIAIQIHKGLNMAEDRSVLLRNVARVAALRHDNVIRVLGACWDGAPITRDGIELLVVTERTHFHVTLHRLLRWCRDNNPKRFTAHCASTFAHQICGACAYVTSQRVAHRHLRTATIMLDTWCNVKISGIEDTPIRPHHGNTRWLPLETLHNDTFTPKSLVWSFGVVLWELCTLGRIPYPHLNSAQQINLYLLNGKRLIRPSGCPADIYSLMLQCWRERARDRPSFDRILSLLVRHRASLPPPRGAQRPHELFPYRDDFQEDDYI